MDLGDSPDEFGRSEYLVGGGVDDGIPFHVHLIDLAPLAGPVLIPVGFRDESTYADNARKLLGDDLEMKM